MSTQTLAQRRAAHALKCVETHRNHPSAPKRYGKYVSYAESLPATVVMNGLGQACATLLAKADGDLEKPHGLLYADLQSWLCGPDPAVPYRSATDADDKLMQAIVASNQRQYVQAQTEALAFLVWLKKFASAYLERGNDE